MKFICFGYFDPEKMDTRPKSEMDALMLECQPHIEELYKSGQVIVDVGLESDAKSLQRVNGSLMVTDGSFVETKAVIGSAFIIEARDMDDAIRLTSLHPGAQVNAGEEFGWGIEIRPIHYFKGIGSEV